VCVDDKALHFDMVDGRTLTVPLAYFPWLLALEPATRKRLEIIGDRTGIWWDEPDEGISVPVLFGLPCE
jgi:Protein of unknown function (DUF2442)